VTALFAVTRALHFASVMAIFGAGAFSWLARARREIDARLGTRLFGYAIAAALASAVASLAFVAAEVSGRPEAMFDPATLWTVASATLYGHLTLLRLAFLVACLVFIWAQPLQREVAATMLGGFALALLAFASHAAAAGQPQFTFVRAGNDAVHLLAGGFWIGGLASLLPFALAKPRDLSKLIVLLRLFSLWGAAAVAMLVVAGTLNGIAILGVVGMRWSDAYLTWLAVKLVLAGVMIALALTNRFGVLPGLVRGEAEARDTIPLTVIAELGCAALILLAVGFLGLTAPMQM
jgi:putative copper resistance protein D